MAESTAKRFKPSQLSIGTHNGHFHADEALAVHMLRMLPAYRMAMLVRTRDSDRLAACHTVVDVGGEYDAGRNRYDHHQRGFDTTFPGRHTKLSSAGLVFLHFGKALVAQALSRASAGEKVQDQANASEGAAVAAETAERGEVGEGGGGEQSKEEEGQNRAAVDLLWKKMYESFIEPVDANDNGITKYDTAALAAASIEPRFSSGGYTLGAMVSRMNAAWNAPSSPDPDRAQDAEDARFQYASTRIGEEFERGLDFYASAWLPAREIVKAAFEKRRQADPQGRVVVFEGQMVPWKDHMYTLEEEAGEKGGVLYVLYREKPVPDAKWRIQCVPETENSFTSRKPLPADWRGLRDEELDNVAGIPGCVFVHASGFTGGNKTYEGVRAMAEKALIAA